MRCKYGFASYGKMKDLYHLDLPKYLIPESLYSQLYGLCIKNDDLNTSMDADLVLVRPLDALPNANKRA